MKDELEDIVLLGQNGHWSSEGGYLNYVKKESALIKKVKVTYFKPSGKYYTSETIEISTELNGYDALHKELPKYHRIRNMFMLVENSEHQGEENEPYIVPHLYHPLETWGK